MPTFNMTAFSSSNQLTQADLLSWSFKWYVVYACVVSCWILSTGSCML